MGDAENLLSDDADDELRETIQGYFNNGFSYETMLWFLERFKNIKMSLSSLKRRLKAYGLKRKNLNVNEAHITDIIRSEIDGPSCLSGYRSMWHTLRIKYGLSVPRRTVENMLQAIDPDGTEDRRQRRLKRRTYTSKGPNDCWHADGYDKLKPFGFPIHGAVDGFSRRVLWLQVGRSNKDPKFIGRLFLNCVKEVGGCPILLRTDPGSENGVMAAMQCLFI